MSVSASGSFVVVSSVRALSLVPRVRGRRVAWRRSSPGCSFLRVAVRVSQRGVRVRGVSLCRPWRWVVGSGSSVVGAVRRVAPACGPPFFGAFLTAAARPCLRAAEARPLRRDQPRGVFKRQRRLAKRGYANDQGLNQTSGYATGIGGSSHDTPRRKPAPVPIG